jgi:hypothetical protein
MVSHLKDWHEKGDQTMLESKRLPAKLSTLEWAQYQKLGSAVLLLGMFLTFFGLGWDIEWHTDVGPDTFWTLPHIFVYSGAALSGFACLTVVLLSSLQAREGWQRPGMIPLFGGLFHAPIGFIVSGFGALGFLSFGFFDQWWHTLYGFDVAISSAPHVGLLLSYVLAGAGGVMVFIQGKHTKPVYLALAMAFSIVFTVPVLQSNMSELGWIPVLLLFPAFFFPLVLLLTASLTRAPITMLYVSVFVFVLRWAMDFVVPMLVSWYAQSLNLALREEYSTQVGMAITTPAFLPLAALAMFGILYFGQARGWKVAPTIYAAGAMGAMLTYVDLLLGSFVLQAPSILIAVALVGTGAGWLGWKLGVVALHSNQELNQNPKPPVDLNNPFNHIQIRGTA